MKLTIKHMMLAFWAYIFERESIRLRKDAGQPWPWTKNPILQKYKFTNVNRDNDRTTRNLLRLYSTAIKKGEDPRVVLLNCALYRYFGTSEMAAALGWTRTWRAHDIARVEDIAADKKARGERVFTGAYIIHPDMDGGPKETHVTRFVSALWKKALAITYTMEMESSWRAGFEVMKTCHGFGGDGFMAKEILSDYLLCLPLMGRSLPDDAATWTPIGPGARRGLNRIFERPTLDRSAPVEQLVAEVGTLRAFVNKRIANVTWKPSPALTAHDIQFCLCEFDKYERVRLGQGRPRSLYHRRADGDQA